MKPPLLLGVLLVTVLVVFLVLAVGSREAEPVLVASDQPAGPATAIVDRDVGSVERRIVMPEGVGEDIDPVALAAGRGTLRVYATHTAGGMPAAGMNLALRTAVDAVTAGSPALVTVRADAEGQAVFFMVPAGEYVLDNDREDRAVKVAIHPGHVTTARFSVARGVRVEGRVVDGAGDPLAGAAIRIGNFVIDTTDGDGRFRALDLPAGGVLTVRAEGFCAVPGVSLRRHLPGQEITFVLDPGATTIEGFVTAPGGMPIPLAEVTIVALSSRDPDVILRTDDNGHFEAAGIRPGERRLRVRAAGHEAAESMAMAATGLPTRVDIALSPLPPGSEPLLPWSSPREIRGELSGRFR